MMDMDGWRDNLHWAFYGEHVLFASLRLSSVFDFFVASMLTVFLCALEKVLTYALAVKWNPLASRHSRVGNAAFRAAVYWVLTFIRLLYMLLAMTFHIGLIVVAVTTLSIGQFVIEYLDTPHPYSKLRINDSLPLLADDRREYLAEDPRGADANVPTNSRTRGSEGYPPQRKSSPAQKHSHADGNNGTTIFTIEDNEDN